MRWRIVVKDVDGWRQIDQSWLRVGGVEWSAMDDGG